MLTATLPFTSLSSRLPCYIKLAPIRLSLPRGLSPQGCQEVVSSKDKVHVQEKEHPDGIELGDSKQDVWKGIRASTSKSPHYALPPDSCSPTLAAFLDAGMILQCAKHSRISHLCPDFQNSQRALNPETCANQDLGHV